MIRKTKFGAIAPLIGLAHMSHVVNGLNFDQIKKDLEAMPMYKAQKQRAQLHERVLQLTDSENPTVAEWAWKLMVQMVSNDWEKARNEGRGMGNRESIEDYI